MKIFNVSAQSKSIGNKEQAFWKEFVYPLQTQVDSLYQYLHYYNPQWRILGLDSKGEHVLSYYNQDNALIEENNLMSVGGELPIVDIWKLHYRWGFKNRLSYPLFYGTPGNYYSLNIGATIYKKDAYDVDSSNAESLSHFLIFESGLAQYYTWKISTGLHDGNVQLRYDWYLSNELDFGLTYAVQFVEGVPRYFFQDNDGMRYQIRYKDSPFDIETLSDYNNYNIRYSNDGEEYYPDNLDPNNPVYQKWNGASEIIADVIISSTENNVTVYEDLIADVQLYQRPGKKSEFQVRLDKSSNNHPSIENSFEVVFS